jgi:uncharacterized protein
MDILKPELFLNKITDLKVNYLKDNNIKGLLIDIDNTVMDYDYNFVDNIKNWLKEMKDKDIKICFVSNTRSLKKRSLIKNDLKCDIVINAKKPLKYGFLKALDIIDLKAKEVAVVGDQIFTDILGGKIINSHTIYIFPISKTESILAKVKRPFEKILLKKYKKI